MAETIALIITISVTTTGIALKVIRDYTTQAKKEREVILQCLLPLLLAVQGEKVNGELSNALKILNEHLIKKGD